MDKMIDQTVIEGCNEECLPGLREDYDALANKLARNGFDIKNLTQKAKDFGVAVPSWGVGTGGTRFARFPGSGEPRNIFEKMDDCGVINQLGRATPSVSLHIPWDKADDPQALKQKA